MRFFSWRCTIMLLLLMLLPLSGLLAVYHSSSELVRLRNAMVFHTITAAQASWTPDNPPAGFRQENTTVPPYLAVLLSEKTTGDNLSQLLHHATMLNQHPRLGGPIQADTVSTLHSIRNHGDGYCADFTQVTNALAYALNIPVREWGMSFDGFGGYGHAFNEIWDEQQQQWVMLDLFNSFYPVDVQSRQPLSALQFRQYLQHNPQQIGIVRLSEEHFGFRDDNALLRYFQRGQEQFYLWWANNSLSYDQHTLIAAARSISPHAEQLVAIVSGQFPALKAVVTSNNQAQIRAMQHLKILMWAIFWLELLLALLLLCSLGGILRNRIRRRKARDLSREHKD